MKKDPAYKEVLDYAVEVVKAVKDSGYPSD